MEDVIVLSMVLEEVKHRNFNPCSRSCDVLDIVAAVRRWISW